MAPSRRQAVRIIAPRGALVAAANAERARREAVAVDAPPLSSSDEEGDERDLPEDISDSSAAEKDQLRGLGSRARRKPHLIIAAGPHKNSDGGSGSDASQRGTKRPPPKDEPFQTESVFNRKARTKPGYGRQAAAAQKSTMRNASASTMTSRTSRTSQPSKLSSPNSPQSSQSRPVFKMYQDDLSDLSEPEEEEAREAKKPKDPKKRQAASLPAPAARFIAPPAMTAEDLSDEEREKTPPKKFKHREWGSDDDDDEKNGSEKARVQFQHSKYTNSDSENDRDDKDGAKKPKPTNGKAKTSKTSKTSTTKAKEAKLAKEEPTKEHLQNLLRKRQKWNKKKENKPLFGELDVVPASPPPAQRAVFKMPVFDSFTGNVGEQDTHSNVSDGNDDGDDDGDKGNASDDTLACKGPAVCPLCKTPLDETVLRDLLEGHHLLVGIAVGRSHVVQLNLLKFDEKLRFCTGHKQRASRLAWTARGYPAIDWAALPARLVRYEAHVKQVILGTPSPFQAAWEAAAAQTDPAVPGYYGRRGLRVLSDAIVQRHAKTLRRRVVEDPLVAARGMVQFVQAVLVPELAVQLIREDMQAGGGGGGLDEARRVLHESAAIGEDVMDEERDVVEDDDEEEDGDGDSDVSF